MAKKWKFNVIFGFTAFLFTYFFSIANNTWQTSSFRASTGFLLFFVLGYMLQFFLSQIVSKKNASPFQKQTVGVKADLEMESKNLDDLPHGEQPFQAIPLHSLHNGEDEKDSSKIAQTIHTWTT